MTSRFHASADNSTIRYVAPMHNAVSMPDPGEAVLEEAAVEIPPHLLVDEAAPEPTAALEALLPLPPHLVEVRLLVLQRPAG